MEQPALGAAFTGSDAISIGLDWSWEQGWAVRLSWRLSGGSTFTTEQVGGLDEAEAHAWISDRLAERFGLVEP